MRSVGGWCSLNQEGFGNLLGLKQQTKKKSVFLFCKLDFT
jgi:hypothetical protein